jgi:uncharacterized membrane protein (DUF4010 family)
LAIANPFVSLDLRYRVRDRGCLRRRRLYCHRAVEPIGKGLTTEVASVGRRGHARLRGARDQFWRRHGCGARLQATAPWARRQAWLLVILISSLSLVGYVLTRILRQARGASLTGLTGGLASSTAVTLSFAKQAHDKPQLANALACGILLAWAVMFARILVLVAALNRPLLGHVLVPFLVMGVVVAGFAALLYFRGGSVEGGEAKGTLEVRNRFSLTAAAKFAAFFAVVLLAVKIVQGNFAAGGLYAVAALAGLTDVDAITLSMAESVKTGDTSVTATAIVIAALTNVGEVWHGDCLGRPLLIATAAMLLAGLAAALLL